MTATFSVTGETVTCSWCGEEIDHGSTEAFPHCNGCRDRANRYSLLASPKLGKDGIGAYISRWHEDQRALGVSGVIPLRDQPMFTAEIGAGRMVANEYKTARDYLKDAMPKPPRAKRAPKRKTTAKVVTSTPAPAMAPTAAGIAAARRRRDAALETANAELRELIHGARADGVQMVAIAKAMGMTRQAVYLFVAREN